MAHQLEEEPVPTQEGGVPGGNSGFLQEYSRTPSAEAHGYHLPPKESVDMILPSSLPVPQTIGATVSHNTNGKVGPLSNEDLLSRVPETVEETFHTPANQAVPSDKTIS